jgi:hypothetical protein
LQTLNVSFTGTNFVNGVTSVNTGTGITVNSTTVSNSTSLAANITILSSASTGSRNFSLINSTPGGGTSTTQIFNVNNPLPTLTSISPAIGAKGKTFDVTFTGTNFISGASSVNVGSGITVNSATVNNSASLTASITISSVADTGSRNFSVTNTLPGGGTSVQKIFVVKNQLELNQRIVSFGNVKTGQYKDTTVTVINYGNDTLKISSITSSHSAFTVRPTVKNIAPGQLLVDTLRFAPITVGVDSALVVIQSSAGSSPDTVKVSGVAIPATSVEELAELPTIFLLSQNYPNPFNPSTNIAFSLPIKSFVLLKVFDLLGREVATIVNDVKVAGSYNATFNAANMPSGVYFYRLQAGSFTETKKLVLLR